jgi:hypothetical protein
MIHQQDKEKPPPDSDKVKTVESGAKGAAERLPPGGDADAPAAEDQTTPSQLTAEEQMALYEQDLKENDWGHQPC